VLFLELPFLELPFLELPFLELLFVLELLFLELLFLELLFLELLFLELPFGQYPYLIRVLDFGFISVAHIFPEGVSKQELCSFHLYLNGKMQFPSFAFLFFSVLFLLFILEAYILLEDIVNII
jgi:hypothetical protein